MCYFACSRFNEFVQHIVRYHRNDPNFIVHCCIERCNYSTKRWNAYKLHVSRKHKNTNEAQYGDNEGPIENDIDIDEVGIAEPVMDLRMQNTFVNAQYLLGLEVQHHLSQAGLDSVSASTCIMVKEHIDRFKAELLKQMREKNMDESVLNDIHIDNILDDSFDDLKTPYLRDKFFTTYCNLVPPKDILLGSKAVRKGGRIIRKRSYGYIVPFLENIKAFLEMPEVWQEVETSHISPNGFLYDICDGTFMKQHHLFRRNKNALQIILNTDDIEIVNPIGSHTKKHKMTMFYYTLGNVSPMYRSRMVATQLLAVAKTIDLKQFGIQRLLADFIAVIKQMANGGVLISLNGIDHLIEGTLVIAPCDTPAAQWLGGFKEGVGFAYRGCRMCDLTGTDMKKVYSYLEIK
jgi:hypothetical protein